MGEPSVDPDPEADVPPVAGLPRWVKALGVTLLLLVLLVVILHATGNSVGGLGSHLSSAAPGPLW